LLNVLNTNGFLSTVEGNLYAIPTPTLRPPVPVDEMMEEKVDAMLSRCTWMDGEIPPMAVARFEWMGMAHQN